MFGGPPIIKRLISGYSDGALIPSGVTVSPSLNISISRIEFHIKNDMAGWHIDGFSRAMELAWSLFGEKPFLEINLGPSVVKDYATADNVNFSTPSLQKIDWQNIALVADINGLTLHPSSKIGSLTLAGNLNLGSTKVSNVSIDAEKFSAQHGSSNYSAHSITGGLAELDFNVPLTEQFFPSALAIENIAVSHPNIAVPKATLEVLVDQEARKFKINLNDIILPAVGGSVENLKVDGHFNQVNVLQELQIASLNNLPSKKSPKFPEVLARVKRLGDEQYQANIEGSLEEFELSDSDNFIGLLPRGNFVIDLEIDRLVSSVTSKSEINFNTKSPNDIFGSLELGFSSDLLTDLGCAFWDCELTDFNFLYKVNFDQEWIAGTANCPNSLCSIAEMDHFVRTSNTINVFKILNQASILNPLSSLYFYSAISSGKKINEGHELKFQF